MDEEFIKDFIIKLAWLDRDLSKIPTIEAEEMRRKIPVLINVLEFGVPNVTLEFVRFVDGKEKFLTQYSLN